MDLILKLTGIALCALVLAGCICRIGLMQSRKNTFSWFLVYVLFAVYALGVGLDLAATRRVDWYESAGIGGLVLYLALTRRGWHRGPPPETVRGGL